jgi:GTPase
MIGEFYGLNIGEVFPIASINGSGTGELLDDAVKHFDRRSGIEDLRRRYSSYCCRWVSLMPVKSSFLNALLGTERSIVTELAGTTRDSIESRYKLFGQDFIIVDTAGIRKKEKGERRY